MLNLILYFLFKFIWFPESSTTLALKIVDGVDALIETVPYQVSLRYGSKLSHFCGGSIMTESIILTAAHCLFDPTIAPTMDLQRSPLEIKQLTIIVGSSKISEYTASMQQLKANKILPHSNYVDGDMSCKDDIGLIFIKGNIELTKDAKMLPLATNDVANGTSCTISGWGSIKVSGPLVDTLQIGSVKILSCQFHRNLPYEYLSSGKICAGGQSNVCHGDSGGPLQCNNLLVGITSLSYCERHKVAIYTKVSAYLDFVNNRISESIVLNNFGVTWFNILIFFILRL